MNNFEPNNKYQSNNGKLKLILPIATVLVIIALLISFYIVSRSKTSAPIKEEQWPVASIIVKKASYAPTITLYGKVESFRGTKLEAAINADIEKVYVKDGSNVQTGQVLIKLDDRDVKILEKQRQAEYEQIKAQIAQEKIKFEADKKMLQQQKTLVQLQQNEVKRLKTLHKKQLSSGSSVDQALTLLNEQALRYTQSKLTVENYENVIAQKQAELLKAEANLDKAKLDIERTEIKAPYDGKVISLNVAVGNRVQPGEMVIELFPTEHTDVRAQIPTADLPVVRMALSKGYDLMAYAEVDGQKISFKLQRIAGNISEGQAGLDGIFVLQSKDLFIAKNRIVQLNLKLPESSDLIALPETALFNGNTVYKIVEGRLQSQVVQVLGTWFKMPGEPYRLIKSDLLKDGDLILTTHLLNARDGLQVKIQQADNPSKLPDIK